MGFKLSPARLCAYVPAFRWWQSIRVECGGWKRRKMRVTDEGRGVVGFGHSGRHTLRPRYCLEVSCITLKLPPASSLFVPDGSRSLATRTWGFDGNWG